MKIQDLMTHDVKSCRPEDSTSAAARLMWENDCGIVPVVDDERRPVGMISDRDVCMAGYTTGRPLAAIAIRDVMSRDVVSCRPGDLASTAEHAMRAAHVRRLPVVDDAGRLVGIVALSDLARAAAKPGTVPVDGLAMGDVADTLASVCEPWCRLDGHAARHAHAAPVSRALESLQTASA